MSNEELVAAIQAGEDRMGELWEQVRRFVVQKALRVPLDGRADVELDDLIQSGYLALVDAASDYKPGEYGFLTHLNYRLKTVFAEATRYKSLRQQRETRAGALSLDTPVGDETSIATLGSFCEDPSGANALEDVEDQLWQKQLHEAIEKALSSIPEQSAEILRQRYYQGLTLDNIGDARGLSRERIRQLENKAIRQLRKPSIACHLRPFTDFDFYCGSGFGSYQRTGLSIQERYLLNEEKLREREREQQKQQEEENLRLEEERLQMWRQQKREQSVLRKYHDEKWR